MSKYRQEKSWMFSPSAISQKIIERKSEEFKGNISLDASNQRFLSFSLMKG